MKNMFSFDILTFSYLIIKKFGRNDGLVTVDSAKWGNFKGVFESKYTRGISHGDTIDLKIYLFNYHIIYRLLCNYNMLHIFLYILSTYYKYFFFTMDKYMLLL